MPDADAVLRAIRERRSVRHYTQDPVAQGDLTAILEAGRWAPSGLNNQPWRFLALPRGDARVEALAAHTKYARIVREAGACIVVLLAKDAMYNPRKDHQGAGACIQNMLLAAHALGYGAVWLGEIVNHEAEALPAIGLSADTYELMAVLAVGRPARPGSSDRKPLTDLLLEAF